MGANGKAHVRFNDESTSLLLKDAPRDYTGARSTFSNFILFSVLFSAVPAAALACLAIATARLGSIGAWQSGILFFTYTLSAVAGATYVVKRLGSRNAVMCGMALYGCYVLCFLIATMRPEFKVPFALTGAGIGGVGAGILWTSQGTYFSQAAEEYTLESGLDWEESTSLLAGYFAFILLAEETFLDVMSSVLIRGFGVRWTTIFTIYAFIAVAATIGMKTVREFQPATDNSNTSFAAVRYKVTAAFRLLRRDSKMKYMIGMCAAFGFAGAFLNSFVSGVVVPVALDDPESSFVGLLVATHGGVASISSLVFGVIASHYGKGPVLIFGALCFSCVALPFLIWPDLTKWGWGGLIMIYSLEGMGRATFEGTLKAVFADYFPYEKEGAFANIIMQNGLSSAFAYVLSVRLRCAEVSSYCISYNDGKLHNFGAFACLVVLMGLLAIAGFLRSSFLYRRGVGVEDVRMYRTRSISTYRTSRMSQGEIIDRKTYQALANAIAEDDDDTGEFG